MRDSTWMTNSKVGNLALMESFITRTKREAIKMAQLERGNQRNTKFMGNSLTIWQGQVWLPARNMRVVLQKALSHKDWATQECQYLSCDLLNRSMHKAR
jgi:hypothetical protein